jgi:hypothetical protein
LPDTCREQKYTHKEGIVQQVGFVYKIIPTFLLIRHNKQQLGKQVVKCGRQKELTISGFKIRTANVLFPCGLGRVASLLLSKLEGLDYKVTYVGGP